MFILRRKPTMTNRSTDNSAAVKSKTEEIVAGGTDIRQRLSEAVARAAEKSQRSRQGLVALVQAVLEGAKDGLDKSTPTDPGDVFRQVIDALGDGFSQTALAARLAVEEADDAGRRFAREDLIRLRDDVEAIDRQFAESVARTLKNFRSMTAAERSSLVAHAERVKERLGRVVGSVLDAIRRDPILLAKEGLQASASSGRQAAGALFQALGGMLEGAGKRLRDHENKR
jgi:hypothetical protein